MNKQQIVEILRKYKKSDPIWDNELAEEILALGKTKLYCVEVSRDTEDLWISHVRFIVTPTWNDVYAWIMKQDLNFDKDYHSFQYSEVKA